jgi:hypothetical protein
VAHNKVDVLESTGDLLAACLNIRRVLNSDGLSSPEAMRLVSDLALVFEMLGSVTEELQGIATGHRNSWQLPAAKVQQSTQDLNGVVRALQNAYSAAFEASHSLDPEMDRGIPAPVPAPPAA